MTAIYKDAGRPVHERVADLLARMTPEEKFAQMHAYWLILDENGNHRERSDLSDEFAGVSEQAALSERLKLGVGQITRPLGTHIVDAKTGVRAANRLQRMMMEETRLGIPALFHEECLVGLLCKDATLFPSSLNYGSTWDPELVQRAAEQIGKEARSVGCQQGLAPVLDVSRDVRWGRTEETFGEDPWLVGVMATAYVKGLQGDKRDLLATLKHYVGHSFSEGARNHAPVHLGFSELNDTFLLPFEMAVKLANAGSVMPAYHEIDNQPGHSGSFLLTTILREQWGFEGIIVADYGGVSLLHQHHGISHDAAESAALAFNAGLDVELPKDDCARHLAEAVERGLISMAKVDEIVARTLTQKFRLGLFEKPYADENGIDLQNTITRQAAREAGIAIVTGDTKVVQRGAADKLFINTAGMGAIPADIHWAAQQLSVGDVLIVTGTLGCHGATILNLREGLGLDGELRSDCAVLTPLIQTLRTVPGVKALRDATRGGVNAVVHEFAASCGYGIELTERSLPVKPAVRGLCELLGLDPLNFANEGKLVIGVERAAAEAVLEQLRAHPSGKEAAMIGEVVERKGVRLAGLYGVKRTLDLPHAEPLPRIC